MPDPITSTKNDTVKAVRRLARTRERRRTGKVLIEGPIAFADMLKAGLVPDLVFFTPDDDATITRLAGLPEVTAHSVSEEVLRSVADAVHPRSPVAVADRPSASTVRQNDIVVLVDVNDPGNAGTIIRTAAAFGWDVGYTAGCVDVWGPKTVRSGSGGHFRTHLIPVDLEAEGGALADHTIVATVVHGGGEDVSAPGPYALLVGNEPHGLADEQVALASELLTIEMIESAESLNVAVAAGIAMHTMR